MCALAALSMPAGTFSQTTPTASQLSPRQWCALNAYPEGDKGFRPFDTAGAAGSGDLNKWDFPNWRSFTLVLPVVDKPSTAVSKVNIPPNSSVWVGACGCVQTGGRGKTWKRYVDPSGPNSDRLYHGTIRVPGAKALGLRTSPSMGGEWVRLKDLIAWQRDPKHLWVTKQWTVLTLGYEDDDYKDNGYWGHDDGTGQQCKGVGNAALVVHFAYHKP
jgi:hypothetical protein